MWLRNKHRYILGPKGLLGCSSCKSQITVFGNFQLQKHILSSPTDVAAQYNVGFISAVSCLVTFSISVSFPLSLTLYTFLCFHTFHCLHMWHLLEVWTKRIPVWQPCQCIKRCIRQHIRTLGPIHTTFYSTTHSLGKLKKASWKLAANDETLLECLKQQEASSDMPVLSLADEITIFTVSSCFCKCPYFCTLPHSPMFPHSPVCFPRLFPHAVSRWLPCLC